MGTTAGLWSGGVPFGLPGDQRRDEARSLVYTSAPLDAPLTILGRARAILHVASSARVMGVAVSLADVDPDGVSQLVAKGMLNGTRRHSLTEPEPLEPGVVEELAIDIDATAWRFLPGHRLRVAIAAADWPNVWPTPEIGTLTVHHGPARPTRLILPVVPDDGDATPPSFVSSPVAVRHAAAFEPPATWTVSEDALTGRVGGHDPARDGTRHAAGEPASSATPAASARWTLGTRRTRSRAAGTAVRARSTATRCGRAPMWSWHPTPTIST